jgi:DNA-binding transcriptional MocR family regulator
MGSILYVHAFTTGKADMVLTFRRCHVDGHSLQAVSTALARADHPYEGFATYYEWLRAQYARKRGILMQGLAAAGFKPIEPEGGFFIMAGTPRHAKL